MICWTGSCQALVPVIRPLGSELHFVVSLSEQLLGPLGVAAHIELVRLLCLAHCIERVARIFLRAGDVAVAIRTHVQRRLPGARRWLPGRRRRWLIRWRRL